MIKGKIIGVLAIFSMFAGSAMAAVNLTDIWDLMTEFTDNTSVIIGIVILAITIGIVVYFGEWIQKVLTKALK